MLVGLVDLLQLLLRLGLQTRVMKKPVRVPNLRKVSMCCFQFRVGNAGFHSQHFVGLQVCAQNFPLSKDVRQSRHASKQVAGTGHFHTHVVHDGNYNEAKRQACDYCFQKSGSPLSQERRNGPEISPDSHV